MERTLETLRDLVQQDIGQRGLRTDPTANLITACPEDFRAACESICAASTPTLAVVTGFYIPHAEPPCGETDGPLGALFLARALVPLGIELFLLTDAFCRPALQAGLEAAGFAERVPVLMLPSPEQSAEQTPQTYTEHLLKQVEERGGRLTHLVAVERAGPSHTPASLAAQSGNTPSDYGRYWNEVPPAQQDRYHTMKGRDITGFMSPAHWLFEEMPRQRNVRTIGIGDGGNEIGMGKIPWSIVRHNIAGGGLVACRVATDYLLVCGVSNWGAYALAAGVRQLLGAPPDAALFDPSREQELLRIMVERGPLVDGVSGRPAVTVDGLSFDRYVAPLCQMGPG